MSEENIVKSKKSSRLNPKKEEKIELHVDSSWKTGEVTYLILKVDIVLQVEEKLDDPPKIIKNFKVYYNPSGDIIGSHVIERLKNDHHLKEENSISFYDQSRELFVYGFVVPKQTYDMTKLINKKFIHNKTVVYAFIAVDN